MVQIKTPEQIAKMREAGLVVAAIHAATREAAVPGRHHQGSGRGRPQGDRRPRREVELPRLRRLPRDDLHLGQRGRRPRHPGRRRPSSRTATSSPSTPARSSTAGTATPRTPPSSGTGHAPELVELSRVTEESMWAGIAAMKHGQPAGRRLPGHRDVHPPPAEARRRQVRDHRGLRRPRHRHRDAHGPAPAELRRRASAARARSWSPASAWRSSRWSRWARRRPRCSQDDWTVITTDGTWSSHWEHSVALTEEGPLVLTAPGRRQGEAGGAGITRRRSAGLSAPGRVRRGGRGPWHGVPGRCKAISSRRWGRLSGFVFSGCPDVD